MAEEKKYYIHVPEASEEVTEEVCRAYYQEERYGRTVEEKDQRNGLTSYDELDTSELTGQEMIPDRDAVSVEDAAIDCVMRDKLYRCLAMLPDSDRRLISALYFDGLSERKLSAKTGVHHMTIHSRKAAILRALKKCWNNKKFFRASTLRTRLSSEGVVIAHSLYLEKHRASPVISGD